MDLRKIIVTIIVPLLTFFSMEVAAKLLPSVLHYYLSLNDRPVKASAVVVLCGGSGTRAKHGAALVEAGYAAKLVLTGTRGEITFVRSILKDWIQRRKQKILVTNYEISNTADAAKVISNLAGKSGNGKLVVVSNSWHLRRVRALVFNRASVWWNNQFYFSAVPHEKDPIVKMNERSRRDLILIETIKYLITESLIRSGKEPL